MAIRTAGGFEYRGSGYLFESATMRLAADGTWSAEADGEEGGLLLSDLPCRGATSAAELVGMTWELHDAEGAFCASAFVGPAALPDGQLNMAGELDVTGGRVLCKRYDAELGVLYVAFQLAIGPVEGDVADGLAHCQVQSPV
ncbi:hypothetical protein [Tuwongella immobilis]|uniref:Uncharacterized protein n=1 Tax=Tuwongella immobilis TaxID=692036 RepID=A0A6C2YW71_9BACT|nr:hypothetical protein [Tuwongella immobilis]VIP05112.1 unnamed protein product [Tuwongella immobilis]VTS07580.1 unnamed protein product [Tuwongella immobilis]